MKTELDKLNKLSQSHGALRPGKGMVTGVIALALAILCFLGVLAFHWPQYLTTPQLRQSYNVDVMRQLLFGSLVLAGALSLFNILMGRARWLALGAFVLIALSLALGGHKVPVDSNFPDHTPYIGLDWFILDLLGSTLIFVFIEKLFALRKEQPVFRPEWQTDFHHFIVNHMIVG
ncbi:MAG: sterol desaturase family protein, partial [Pseudomonadota bacterium]